MPERYPTVLTPRGWSIYVVEFFRVTTQSYDVKFMHLRDDIGDMQDMIDWLNRSQNIVPRYCRVTYVYKNACNRHMQACDCHLSSQRYDFDTGEPIEDQPRTPPYPPDIPVIQPVQPLEEWERDLIGPYPDCGNDNCHLCR